MFEGQYFSPFNCIIQKYKRESLLYFAPERWEKTNPTTYKTDSFSVGICLILLDNYLVFSEEQLAEKFASFSKPYAEICADNIIIRIASCSHKIKIITYLKEMFFHNAYPYILRNQYYLFNS